MPTLFKPVVTIVPLLKLAALVPKVMIAVEALPTVVITPLLMITALTPPETMASE